MVRSAGINFPSVIDHVENIVSDRLAWLFIEPGVIQNVRLVPSPASWFHPVPRPITREGVAVSRCFVE